MVAKPLLVCVDFPGGSDVKHLPTMREARVQSLAQEDPLEKEMATHSSTLTWKIPWTEEPVDLQSMGSQMGSDTTERLQCQCHVGLCTIYPFVVVQSLSRVQFFFNSMDCSPPGSSVQWDFPGENTGVGCHFLLHSILLSSCFLVADPKSTSPFQTCSRKSNTQ